MDVSTFEKTISKEDREELEILAKSNNMTYKQAIIMIANNVTKDNKMIMNKSIRRFFNIHPTPVVNKDKQKLREEKNKKLDEKDPKFKKKIGYE